MIIRDLIRISKLVNNCPYCNHDLVGTNSETSEYHGSIEVSENLYTRKCRCGFGVTFDTNTDTTPKKLSAKIEESLKLMI